jgi:hypothetical protein
MPSGIDIPSQFRGRRHGRDRGDRQGRQKAQRPTRRAGSARPEWPARAALAGTRSVTAEQPSCALSSMKLRAYMGACIEWRRAVFVSTALIRVSDRAGKDRKRQNHATVRVRQRGESGKDRGPALMRIRRRSETGDGRVTQRIGRRRLRACPAAMGNLAWES